MKLNRYLGAAALLAALWPFSVLQAQPVNDPDSDLVPLPGPLYEINYGDPADPGDDDALRIGPAPGLDAAAAGPSFEEQVLELVNQERAFYQLPPLKLQNQLAQAAEGHSAAMASRNFFAHCDLDTQSSPGQRIAATGYSPVTLAENIAAGQTSPASVMNAWMNSSGHRANILSSSAWELGVGYVYDGGDSSNVRLDNGNCSSGGTSGPFRHYWTQNFGRRSGVYPLVIDREAYSTASRNVDLYLYGAGWAMEMRLRNAGESWSDWMPFQSEYPWRLSAGGGTKTVQVQLLRGGTTVTSSDTIVLEGAATPAGLIFSDGFEGGNLNRWSVVVP